MSDLPEIPKLRLLGTRAMMDEVAKIAGRLEIIAKDLATLNPESSIYGELLARQVAALRKAVDE